jgi:hypothetical protein
MSKVQEGEETSPLVPLPVGWGEAPCEKVRRMLNTGRYSQVSAAGPATAGHGRGPHH